MEIRIIAPIYNFGKSDVNFSFDILEGFRITDDIRVIYRYFLDDVFKRSLGELEFNNFDNTPFIYFVGDMHEIMERTKSTDIVHLQSKLLHLLNVVIHSLWLFADNAVTMGRLYFYIPSNNRPSRHYVNYSYFLHSYTNSQGQGEPLYLTKENIFKFPFHSNALLHQLVFPDNTKSIFMIEHKSFNLIQRSLFFIEDARKAAYLPIKITMYAASLECLFTFRGADQNEQITENVRNRAAALLGGSEVNKEENREVVRKAYGIRSDFMHGGAIKKNREELKKISKDIDGLCRKIISKILFEGLTVFIESPDTPGGQKRKKEYFDKLEAGEAPNTGINAPKPPFSTIVIPLGEEYLEDAEGAEDAEE